VGLLLLGPARELLLVLAEGAPLLLALQLGAAQPLEQPARAATRRRARLAAQLGLRCARRRQGCAQRMALQAVRDLYGDAAGRAQPMQWLAPTR
jgi:hypothetical protein